MVIEVYHVIGSVFLGNAKEDGGRVADGVVFEDPGVLGPLSLRS